VEELEHAEWVEISLQEDADRLVVFREEKLTSYTVEPS